MINIDVYSDLSCPWCYVGKRRLDKAIQQFTAASVTVNWHPYIIDKNTAPKGEEYMAYNIRRYNNLLNKQQRTIIILFSPTLSECASSR